MCLCHNASSIREARWLRQLGDTMLLPYPLRRLAQLALMRRDTERATRLCLESLALNRAVGDPQGIAACLVGLGAIAVTTLNPERAARLLGAANGLLASVETELLPYDRRQYEDALATARAQLDAVAFEPGQLSRRLTSRDSATQSERACATMTARAEGFRPPQHDAVMIYNQVRDGRL